MIRRRIDVGWRVESIGDYPTVSPLNARRIASVTETRLASLMTFGEAVKDLYTEAIGSKCRSCPLEAKAYLTRDYKRLLLWRLDRITRGDIVAVVHARTASAPSAASKLLAIVEQFSSGRSSVA